jgi:DnaK suppressor protein
VRPFNSCQKEVRVDSDKARTRLQTLLEELESSRGTFAHDQDDLGTGELSHVDQHPAEVASELTEQERDEALLAVVEDQRAQVLEALERVEAGTYGDCIDCGKTLPDERLDARPEAARCVDCQHTMELAR